MKKILPILILTVVTFHLSAYDSLETINYMQDKQTAILDVAHLIAQDYIDSLGAKETWVNFDWDNTVVKVAEFITPHADFLRSKGFERDDLVLLTLIVAGHIQFYVRGYSSSAIYGH